MPPTQESIARTRAFARFLGPFLIIFAGALEVRAGELGAFLPFVFENPVIVWILGANLIVGALFILAFHQYWRSAPAVVISLFGWFLLLRGLVMLYAPQLMARAATTAVASVTEVRIGFSLLGLIGLWMFWVGWIARPAGPTPIK